MRTVSKLVDTDGSVYGILSDDNVIIRKAYFPLHIFENVRFSKDYKILSKLPEVTRVVEKGVSWF